MRYLSKQNAGGQAKQGGFTIIELLIATAVFSVVLLVITEGIIQFNRVYYGGITQSQTQNAARNILENISQAIQFSGGTVTPTPGTNPTKSYRFCVGSTRYRYKLGHELSNSPTGSQTHHALLMDTPNGGCKNSGTVASINTAGATGTELLSPNMRLSRLSVTEIGTTNSWIVDVKVVYGDDDLFSHPTRSNAVCHFGWAGAQFCAASELSTTVEQRVIAN